MLLNMVECIKINLLQKKKKMFGLKKISVIIKSPRIN